MDYIRIFKQSDYDPRQGAFSSVSITKSSEDGISIFDPNCIANKGKRICEYFRNDKVYARVAEEPPIFLEISTDFIPDKCVLGKLDKKCHLLIKGLDGAEQIEFASKIAREIPIEKFRICNCDNSDRPLTLADLPTKSVQPKN